MLLTLILNLGMAGGTYVELPPTVVNFGGGGSAGGRIGIQHREKKKIDSNKIVADDSEIIAIVELVFKNFII